mmetsp:Transcript_2403/g.5619  ORF Transcript_2403/g.5619 Transcript_2403/m.5619 type:complete len:200 (-) Transcript_2403:672-1271(-)
MSGIPPALTATTGTPLAIASRTTNPRVSLSDGIMNTSADAYAFDKASPRRSPVNRVLGVPSKSSSRFFLTGPSPTKTRCVFGFLLRTSSKIGFKRSKFFSLPRRPTYIKIFASLSLPVNSARTWSDFHLGWNTSVSTAFLQTAIRFLGTTFSCRNSPRITEDVTRVMSARLCVTRMRDQVSLRAHDSPYDATYLGMCVW